MKCEKCNDQGCVCEFHPETPWNDGDGCCGGAGMLCVCHPSYKEQEKNKNENS